MRWPAWWPLVLPALWEWGTRRRLQPGASLLLCETRAPPRARRSAGDGDGALGACPAHRGSADACVREAVAGAGPSRYSRVPGPGRAGPAAVLGAPCTGHTCGHVSSVRLIRGSHLLDACEPQVLPGTEAAPGLSGIQGASEAWWGPGWRELRPGRGGGGRACAHGPRPATQRFRPGCGINMQILSLLLGARP